MTMYKPKLITATFILLISLSSFAQSWQPQVTAENQIEAARKQLRIERKLVLARELALTPEESDAFWPLYRDYEANMVKIGDERVKLIVGYANNFGNMTPEYAEQMLKDYFHIEKRLLKTRKKYAKRFSKVLPSVKVARLFQVENKLNAILEAELAAMIPIVESDGSQAN